MTKKFLQGLVIFQAVCAFGQGQACGPSIETQKTNQATNAPIVSPTFRYPPFDARFPHPLKTAYQPRAVAPEPQR